MIMWLKMYSLLFSICLVGGLIFTISCSTNRINRRINHAELDTLYFDDSLFLVKNSVMLIQNESFHVLKTKWNEGANFKFCIAEVLKDNKSFFRGLTTESFLALFGDPDYGKTGYTYENLWDNKKITYKGCWFDLLADKFVVDLMFTCH